VDNNGNVLDAITYDAWGNITSQTNPSAQPLFTFAGMAEDAALDLDYDWARFYAPSDGRFINQDPMQFAAGVSNLYCYVGNDPTNAIDPSGLRKLFGQEWVWPWDPNASWNLKQGVKQYAGAAAQMYVGTTAGAAGGMTSGALKGAVIGGVTGGPVGVGPVALGGLTSGGIAGAVNGFLNAAEGDDIREVAKKSFYEGLGIGTVAPQRAHPTRPPWCGWEWCGIASAKSQRAVTRGSSTDS